MALADPEELEGTKTLGEPGGLQGRGDRGAFETAELETGQSEVGMSEVEMQADAVVVDPDQRNVGSSAGSEDAMTVAAEEE